MAKLLSGTRIYGSATIDTTLSLGTSAIFNGSTSGTTTVLATAVAGTTTLTLPAATDTLVGRATTDTLTNKTLSSATLTGTLTAGGGVGTSGQVLTSTGTGVQWGSSGGGSTTNPLTIGTGLSGSSFNGSAAVTIAIDSTVTTNSGTQTLTNKTLSAPVVTGTLTANGVVGASGQFLSSTGTGVQWSSAIAGGYMAIYARASTFNVFVYVGQLPVYARAGTFSVTI